MISDIASDCKGAKPQVLWAGQCCPRLYSLLFRPCRIGLAGSGGRGRYRAKAIRIRAELIIVG